MNITRKLIGSVLLLVILAVYAAPVEKVIDIYIRVFKIPRIQKWEAKLSDGNGDFTQIRAEGDLTAVFPDGIILLQTELSPISADSAIQEAIQTKVYFGSSKLEADKISIEKLKNIHLCLNESQSSQEIRFEKKILPHQTENFILTTGLRSAKKNETIMNLKFETGWSSVGGRLGAGYIGTIFEQTVILAEQKTLLIGFPSYDKGPRGTVYWLAIGVQPALSESK